MKEYIELKSKGIVTRYVVIPKTVITHLDKLMGPVYETVMVLQPVPKDSYKDSD